MCKGKRPRRIVRSTVDPEGWGWLAGWEECAQCQAAFKGSSTGSQAACPKLTKQCKERGGQEGRKNRGMVAGKGNPKMIRFLSQT